MKSIQNISDCKPVVTYVGKDAALAGLSQQHVSLKKKSVFFCVVNNEAVLSHHVNTDTIRENR